MITRKSVTVTVGRTVQVNRYNPSEIIITEVADIPDGMTASEVKLELYKSCTASVQKFMRAEIKKYKIEDTED